MKKIQTLTYILFPFLAASIVWAQTPTKEASSEATPTTTKTKQIEELKERLATKVAELTQTQRRAIYGTVKSTSLSTVTIETATKDVKIELTDEIKIFQYLKGKRTSLTTDDLTKGDVVSVFGEYDATLDILKAKVIFIQDPLPQHASGTVSAIDKTEFTLTVTPPEGPAITVDIERFTKVTLWDGTTLIKGGFSKIQVGDTIHVVGSPVPKKENRLSALRILDLGDLSGSRPTPTATPTKESSPSPTLKILSTPKVTSKPTLAPSSTP